MDPNMVHEQSVSLDDFDSVAPEAGSKADLLDGMSYGGEVNEELERTGELLTRVELDLACSSEKLFNLNILTMHVATRESDFESLVSEKDHMLIDCAEKALEFDLLSGILDSEVRELDKFMCTLQTDIVNAREIVSSFEHLGETFVEMEKKLCDSEESLRQSQEQVSDISTQCSKFKKTLSYLDGARNWNGDNGLNFSKDDQPFNVNDKIKMQTAEQQRNVLRMLEKSLAREMDLEKKLIETRQNEEVLKLRLLSSEGEIFCMEEEAAGICERCFEAENATEVLMGISKELLARLQILQFNLNSSIHRESEMRSNLEVYTKRLESRESTLQKLESSSAKVNDFLVAQSDSLKAKLTEAEDRLILSDSEVFTLREMVSSLEKQLKDSESELLNAKASMDISQEQHDALGSEIRDLENAIEDLKDKLSTAQNRAESAEAKCRLLSETNMELNEELGLLKSSGATAEKVEALERQLKESDIQLQLAIASAEASQEKQNLLNSTIGDMEDLIQGLKLRVSKTESRADSAEERCIIFSESNAELSEEVSFLRGRLECLEASLNQAEELKMMTVKDIGIRTKVITNLLMQMAVERERLHQQISSLALQNKILVVKLKQMDKDPSVSFSHGNNGHDKVTLFSKQDVTTVPSARETEEGITNLSDAYSQADKTSNSEFVDETEVKPAAVDATSEYGTAREIDARLLNYKHICMALLVVLISAVAYFYQK